MTKSPTAMQARRGAEHVLQWCLNSDNEAMVKKIIEELIKDLKGALVSPTGKGLQRDKIWESYYCIHATENFSNRSSCVNTHIA